MTREHEWRLVVERTDGQRIVTPMRDKAEADHRWRDCMRSAKVEHAWLECREVTPWFTASTVVVGSGGSSEGER